MPVRPNPRTPCAPLLALLALPVLFDACSTNRAALALPSVNPEVTYRMRKDAHGATERVVRAELFAVAEPPVGRAVAAAAAAIVSDSGAPFRGRSRLPTGTRWLDGDQVRAWLQERQQFGDADVQELGAAEVLVLSDVETELEVPDTPLPRVNLRAATTADDAVHVTLLSLADDGREREELHIADDFAGDQPRGLFVPGAIAARGGHLLLLLPEATKPAEGRSAEVRSTAAAAEPPAPEPDHRPGSWQVALRAVGAQNRRPALLGVVRPLDAQRLEDVLLAADEPALIAMTAALRRVDPRAENVGWRLERALWRALLPRVERDDRTPAMRAAMLRQLGPVGDDPTTLELLLAVCDGGDAFAAAVREENLMALDDRSAAVRVLADGWLHERGVHVDDYDPLAERRSRRSALRRHLQEAQR